MCGSSADANYQMHNIVQAASRLLIRVSIAAFTVIVLLLIQSAFWSNRVSLWMQLIILATALLSYFRPKYSLLLLAAIVPLGQIGSRTLNSNMRGAEALVLAFLAGALVRGWTLRQFRSFPSTRLETAALVFGLIVAASCIEQLWFLQIQRDYPWPFIEGVLGYASQRYIATWQGFGMIFFAMLLLEGLALLLLTERYSREDERFARRLTFMLVAGAVGTALLTIGVVAREFWEAGPTQTGFVEFFSVNRWSVHIGDMNAAGSFFAMMMFIAVGIALINRMHRAYWLAAGALLLCATLMTGSRTAVATVGLLAVLVAGRFAFKTSSSLVRVTLALAAVLAIAGSVYLTSRTTTATGAPPSEAITIRKLFLQTTANMLAAEPAFGIGIGQFNLWSWRFGPPELLTVYKGDNAHNNFAQIAGELGGLGLAAFVAVLAWSLWAPRVRDGGDLRAPIVIGLAAFILTWLGGHPLLVPEVAFPFWMALGLAASLGLNRWRHNVRMGYLAVAAVAVVLLSSLPFRIDANSARIDFSRVTYGISPRQTMSDRARMFVPAVERRIDVPLRARAASDADPILVDVFVNHVAMTNITMTGREWQRARIELPPGSSGRFHEIELRIRHSDTTAGAVVPPSVEVGKLEIIAKPNG